MGVRQLRQATSDLRDDQLGIVRRDQVVGIAMTDATLRHLLSSRRWQAVLPSVYATFSGDLSTDQRLVAARLYTGPDGQITGPAALRVLDFRYVPHESAIHVLVPHRCHLSSKGFVVVQRTQRPDATATAVDGLPVVSAARAVADSARLGHDLRTVRAFVAEAVQRRFATVAQVRAELEAGPRRGSGTFRQVVAEIADGVRSAPEAEFKEIVDTTAVLSRVLWNPTLLSPDGDRLPTPDGWLDEVGIAIEIDSREHHASPDGWSRTLARHNELAAFGALVLHFTPSEIRSRPELVRRRLVDAYVTRLRTGDRGVLQVAMAT
jgi:hypothetical protein